MSEPIRPSTVLAAQRTPFTVTTEDGQTLIAEVSAPLDHPTAAILCCRRAKNAVRKEKRIARKVIQMGGEAVVEKKVEAKPVVAEKTTAKPAPTKAPAAAAPAKAKK